LEQERSDRLRRLVARFLILYVRMSNPNLIVNVTTKTWLCEDSKPMITVKYSDAYIFQEGREQSCGLRACHDRSLPLFYKYFPSSRCSTLSAESVTAVPGPKMPLTPFS